MWDGDHAHMPCYEATVIHSTSPFEPRQFPFARRRDPVQPFRRDSTRDRYQWVARIRLDPSLFGTHSLRRTKATLIYRRTGKSACGPAASESTVWYHVIELDDALAIAEQVDV
jgi:hypothetical protein